MDYSKFEVEDFLCDDSFLEYCLETNPEAVKFWNDWLDKHPEKALVAERARKLFYTLNGNITAETFHRDHELFKSAVTERLGKHIVKPDFSAVNRKNYVRRLWIGAASLAACGILVASLFFLKSEQTKIPAHSETLSYATPMGKKRKVKLPDGSVVTLNGGSHLQLQKGFNTGNRELSLTGEGYFVVVHNAAKPFIVHTEKITIRDVGTEFNVKAYLNDKATEASLINGLIEITIKGTTHTTVGLTPVILAPNKKFILINDAPASGKTPGITKPIFDVKNITTTENNSVAETDWTQNKLTFVDEPLSEIATQIERWYGVKVIIANPALNNLHFTATFDHGDIVQILEALKLSGNFNYRKEDNMIRIY